MKYRILLLLVWSILTTAGFVPPAHAQVNSNVFYADYSVLPSPGASSAAGYATQVNLSTGTAQISVPLCNLRGHGMQLPVSIGYQATGIKVQQLPGPVGLGWSLQSGGVITRVVRGKPDDDRSERSGNQTSGYWDSGYSGANGTYKGTGHRVDAFLDNNGNLGLLGDGRWDAQPDIYYFSFMGRSGRFVLDKDGNPVLIPQQDIKINRLLPKKASDFYKNENDQRYATWVITTPDGTSYLFGNPDPMAFVGVNGSRALPNGVELTEYTVTTPAVACFPASTKTQPSFASSWYLTSVISPQGNTEFTFKYRAGSPITYKDQTNLMYNRLWKEDKNEPRCSPATNTIYTITNQTKILNPLYVVEIRSPHGNGSLRFNYQPAKLDASVEGGESLQFIEVRDARDAVRNTIRFTYSGLSSDFRLGFTRPARGDLTRLQLNTVQIGSQPPYEFTYNPLSLPLRNSESVDYWGYFNGKIRNNGAVPGVYYRTEHPWHSSQSFPGADRAPSEGNMQAGMLTGMKLPGGGSVTYQYSMHQYGGEILGVKFNRPFGGLRIQLMTVSDGVDPGKDIVTRYKYTDENNSIRSSGTADATIASDLPYYRIMYMVQDRAVDDLRAHFLVRSSQPTNPDVLTMGNGIVYNCVTVSQTGRGKTVYRFTGFDTHPDQAPEEFSVNGYQSGNKTPQEFYWRPHTPNSSRAWERGLLTDVKVYSEEGKLKSWKHSDYVFNAPTGKPNPVVRGMVFDQFERIVSKKDQITQAGGGATAFGVYREESQWMYLERTTERLYDQQDDQKFAETITHYTYNPLNLQIARIRATDSEGRTTETRFKYPADYPSVSPVPGRYQWGTDLKAVLNEMVRRHMTDIPVETQVWQEAPSGARKLLSATLTKYQFAPKPIGYYFWQYTGDWEPGPTDPSVNPVKRTMIVPGEALQLHTEEGLSSYTESSLDAAGNLTYDQSRFQSESVAKMYSEQGRLLEAEGRDGIPVAAIWNHTGSLPVASVANARYNQVAFASFENSSDQGWTYNPAYKLPLLALNDPALAKTGYGAYQLSGEADNAVTRSSLDPAQTYVVSFWASGHNAVVSVNGTRLSIPDNTKWRYYRLQLSGSSSVEIKRLSGGTAFLDELWLHPADARVASFVADPVTGVTSRTGSDGLTIHYEYDSMGRLAQVKDDQRNIVTNYQYGYKDQDAPRWIDTGQTRCVTGTDGQPTGEKEQRDRNANSPTYNQVRWLNTGQTGACPGRAPR